MYMQVEVKILSGLMRAAEGPVEVADGANGMDVLRAMGVKTTESIIMIVNGRRRDLATQVMEGDRIHFMTPMAWGMMMREGIMFRRGETLLAESSPVLPSRLEAFQGSIGMRLGLSASGRGQSRPRESRCVLVDS